MKRPVVLIVGAAAALLVAAVGVSAHTGFAVKFAGVSHSQSGDEASGARLESPEPSESPEASPTAEPTEKPEASPEAEPTEKPEPTETPEAPEQEGGANTGGTSGSGEHDGDHHGSGGGGD